MTNQSSKSEKFRKLLGDEWYESLEDVINSNYWTEISNWIAKERKKHVVYPEQGSDLLFKAFRTTPLSEVKVVILGQDPYHDGSYDGFAFSNTMTEDKKKISPSLRNILEELFDSVYVPKGFDDFNEWLIEQREYLTNLEDWAKQGVLLINTAHTVRKGYAGSHTDIWKHFTRQVITKILQRSDDATTVWILWGNFARNIFAEAYDKANPVGLHYTLVSPHPSPFSAYQGFFGSDPFNKANEYLMKNNLKPINW